MKESQQGYKESDLANQCLHRYNLKDMDFKEKNSVFLEKKALFSSDLNSFAGIKSI